MGKVLIQMAEPEDVAAAQQLPYAWPEVPNKPAAAAAASDQTMLMADAKPIFLCRWGAWLSLFPLALERACMMLAGHLFSQGVIQLTQRALSILNRCAGGCCRPDRSYVLTGGLGGFGLALAAWMVQRGARSLLLTSKRGLRTGAQAKAVRQLRSAGAEVGSPRLSCALSRPTSVAHVLLQRMHACTVLLRSPVSVCLPACSLWS